MSDSVRLGKLPGTIGQFDIQEGDTVFTLCQRAGIDLTGFEVRVNGDTVGADKLLNDGDQILIVRDLKGNN